MPPDTTSSITPCHVPPQSECGETLSITPPCAPSEHSALIQAWKDRGETRCATVAIPEDVAADENLVAPVAAPDKSELEQGVPRSGVDRVRNLLPDAVLVKIAPGRKRPVIAGWQILTRADMTPAYIESLRGNNIGVVLGQASGGLISIDIDSDEFVEPFLKLNPRLRDTLRSKRVRGCNIWVIVRSQYPKMSKIKTNDGQDWGEWRSTGGQTVIHGEVMDTSKGETAPTSYRILIEARPIEIDFVEIVWPDNLEVPWRSRQPASPPPAVPPSAGETSGNDDPVDFQIILPGGTITITECAERLFRRIGQGNKLFFRGGAVMEVVANDDGILALDIVKPTAFRSRIEHFGSLFSWRSGANGESVLKKSVCPEETAHALLKTLEARVHLPRIATVVNSPVMVEGNGELLVLPQGYHAAHGGILVVNGSAPPEVPVEKAVESLRSILSEFDFQTPGDLSRALAQLITPALKMGGLIRGFVPADVAEADQSQSGKTFRQNLTGAVYNEQPRVVARRVGGVGSVDESFSQALIEGRPFIQLDNFRGALDSQFIEAFMTAKGSFAARVPHRGDVMVDPSRFILMLTSNGVETTRDMANRSCIIRIRKRVGFAYRVFPEGGLDDHVAANQPYFLGCVFAVIRRWVEYGKPRTDVTAHDFREWAQTLDWIVQGIFKAAPMLEGHRGAQERVSNPAMTFLRLVALEMRAARRLGKPQSAGAVVGLCEEANIEIPGLKSGNSPDAARKVGTLMSRAFGDGDSVVIDEFTVKRAREGQERPDGGGTYESWTYRFCQ